MLSHTNSFLSNQVWARGIKQKRHPHALRNVSFMNNSEGKPWSQML
jgi:hypothetical protein